MHDLGLGGWPARRALMTPDRTAFVFGEDAVTYAEFAERTATAAQRLRADGVGRGDRVAYLGPNHLAFVETMFAAHRLGAVFVPLNFRLAAPEIDYVLADSEPEVLVYAPECAGTVAALENRPRRIVALTAPQPGEQEYETWLAAAGPEPIEERVGFDETALILYTSGTTGRPKGAMLTHGNLVWNTVNLLVGVDVVSDDVALITAPLFHVAALDQTLLPTFIKGACSVIAPGWDVDACYDRIERNGITWMFGVTTMFAELAASPRWAEADLSSLRIVMSGGAAVPEALIRTYQERGLVFCQGYGMTETAPGATFLEAGESVRKVGSAGVPVFFTGVRVVRPDGTDADPGEPGEVLVKGPNVSPGYWRNSQATDAAFEDGWFRSGDLASFDGEGHLHVVDRVKDMFISGGENVYPAEVENALFEHPAVAEAAVVGVPDERWGEVGRAFVVCHPGSAPTGDELREFLRTRLARYKVPVHVDLVDSLPRTGSGKIQKSELRKR